MPTRLLGIALPLTIVVGTALAVPLFGDLVFFEAMALAVLLSPTDAALGQTVVADRRLPNVLRQGLSVESGLNDGVCVPILVAAVAFAELEEQPEFDGEVLVDLVKEVVVASAVGLVVAGIVVALMRFADQRGWMTRDWSKIVPLATAVIAYAAAVEFHGSGFIGAFGAGLVYGRILGERAHETVGLDEELGQVLSAATFLLFGAVMVGSAAGRLDLETVVYAVLSLTVVRMLPVALSMIRSGASLPTMLYAGWFGPRGLATIVFALTIVEESGLQGTQRIVDVATIVVLLSVAAHGLSAPWLTDRYADWLGGHPEGSSGGETVADDSASMVPPQGNGSRP